MDVREVERGFDHPVIGDDTLPAMFEASAERNSGGVAQRYKGGIYDRSLVAAGVIPEAPSGQFASLRYEEMRDIVRHLAAGLRDLGVETGDRVGLFADTRLEWAQTDFAVLAAGGEHGEVGLSPLQSRVGEQPHAVAGLDTQITEPGREVADDVPHLLVSQTRELPRRRFGDHARCDQRAVVDAPLVALGDAA